MKDYYDILNVNNGSSADEIKKAYRKQSLIYHPDRHNNDKIKSDKFNKITEAYTTLSDELKRKNYDNSLNNNFVELDIDPAVIINMLLNKYIVTIKYKLNKLQKC